MIWQHAVNHVAGMCAMPGTVLYVIARQTSCCSRFSVDAAAQCREQQHVCHLSQSCWGRRYLWNSKGHGGCARCQNSSIGRKRHATHQLCMVSAVAVPLAGWASICNTTTAAALTPALAAAQLRALPCMFRASSPSQLLQSGGHDCQGLPFQGALNGHSRSSMPNLCPPPYVLGIFWLGINPTPAGGGSKLGRRSCEHRGTERIGCRTGARHQRGISLRHAATPRSAAAVSCPLESKLAKLATD